MNRPARAVVGIDAAWTERAPSGVALLIERSGGWECAAVAPSYACFLSGAPWGRSRLDGTPPDPRAILEASRRIAPDSEVQVVALDLPLSTEPITHRRVADDAVSREFGARGCGVHSPTPARPGPLSETVRRGFRQQGFRLATTAVPRTLPALLEVYPHTALLSLLGADRRVPYKVARSRKYWPTEPPGRRRSRLLSQWRTILEALRNAGIELSPRVFALPAECASFSEMKRYEDGLDAIVCAWVGLQFLHGRADALGDETGAIWTPRRARASDLTVTGEDVGTGARPTIRGLRRGL